jgi:hypothetical protein
MTEDDFEDFMATIDGTMTYDYFVNNKIPIQIGDITIPADKKLFNKMWLNKEFDNIDPALFIKINRSLIRGIHTGRFEWSDYFFLKREQLMNISAYKLWTTSEYYNSLLLEVNKIICFALHYDIYSLQSKNYYYEEDLYSYFLKSPEHIMFPKLHSNVNPNLHMNSSLLRILTNIVERFQHLGKKTHNERTSIYMQEFLELSSKIQFIHTIMYFGYEVAIHKFKMKKGNYLTEVDNEIKDIEIEPNAFTEEPYKTYLYKLYLFCMSEKSITKEIADKFQFLIYVLSHYKEFVGIAISYVIPFCSLIKQSRIKTECSYYVLEYLTPKYITSDYVIKKLSKTFAIYYSD